MTVSLRLLRVSQSLQGVQRYGQLQLKSRTRSLTTRATTHTLNTGAKIPALGFGTFQDANAQEDAVSTCLKAGFRLIDTAQVYNVEVEVGKGIKKSGVPREEIFVGTKLWCNTFHPDDVENALDASLKDLSVPRDADSKMILGQTTYVDTWKAMEKLLSTGKVKAIGVSNFSKGEIQTLLDQCSVVRRADSA